jgi:acetoin utilization deacetylase AcuC-like enzyme
VTKVPTVWDDRYNVEAAPLTSTTKQARVVALARKGGLLDEMPTGLLVDTDPVFAEIAQTHDPAYVEAVRTGEPRQLAQSQGFQWSPAFSESVARIWAGHEEAIFYTRDYPLVLHPVSGAHHAHAERGGGFCTFTYLVGAAKPLLKPTDHCLILDLDAHFGDGTAALIKGDPRFTLFDIHGGDKNSNGPALLDLGVLAYTVKDAATYFDILTELLPTLLDVTKPTLVQYLAGADPYERDPVGSIKGMSAKRLRDRDRFVFDQLRQRNIPAVVTLAGGYVTGITERLHVATIEEMSKSLDNWR